MATSNNHFLYRALAVLAKHDSWTKGLKPELLRMKEETAFRTDLKETIDEAAIRDIRRATQVQLIERIIRLVERAEDMIKNTK